MQFLQILPIKIINHQSEMHVYNENNSMVETLWKAKHVVSLSTVEVIPGGRDVMSECSCVQL